MVSVLFTEILWSGGRVVFDLEVLILKYNKTYPYLLSLLHPSVHNIHFLNTFDFQSGHIEKMKVCLSLLFIMGIDDEFNSIYYTLFENFKILSDLISI